MLWKCEVCGADIPDDLDLCEKCTLNKLKVEKKIKRNVLIAASTVALVSGFTWGSIYLYFTYWFIPTFQLTLMYGR